jgi:hypothetical protein
MAPLIDRCRRLLATLGVMSVLIAPTTQLAHARSMEDAAVASCSHAEGNGHASHSSMPQHHHGAECCEFCGSLCESSALPVAIHRAPALEFIRAVAVEVAGNRPRGALTLHLLPFSHAPPASV